MPKRDYLHLVALAKTTYLLIYVALAQWSIICCGAYLNIVLLIYVALAQSIFFIIIIIYGALAQTMVYRLMWH